MSSLSPKIVWNINRLLSERKISQAEMARTIDMKPEQLNRYLKGKQPIPMNVAELIAAALRVGFDVLLSTPPPAEAPPRDPSELEMLAAIVDRWKLHPDRKAALLGLLQGYIEEQRLSAVRAVLLASKGELLGITAACLPVIERVSSKGNQTTG